MTSAGIPQLSPQDVRSLQGKAPDGIVLLDVREPWEHERAHLPGSIHIPMAEIPGRLDELNPEQTYVVLCHHGNRSQQVAMFLRSRGFRDMNNLAGGIDAWALALDPNLPRY